MRSEFIEKNWQKSIKGFNRLTLQSTINNSADDHSNKNVAKSDQKSNPLVDTHTSDGKKEKIADTDTTKGNSAHKLLTNRWVVPAPDGIIISISTW